jgi:hypothetical protein
MWTSIRLFFLHVLASYCMGGILLEGNPGGLQIYNPDGIPHNAAFPQNNNITSRAGSRAVLLNNMIYIIGGFTSDSNLQSSTSDVFLLNPAPFEISRDASMQSPRANFAVAVNTEGKLSLYESIKLI